MISSGYKGLGQSGEDTLVVVMDERRLAVYGSLTSDDLTSIRLPHGLVAKTYPKDRAFSSQSPDGLHADAGFGRSARTGRYHQMGRLLFFYVRD
jgi:hypothetical protein